MPLVPQPELPGGFAGRIGGDVGAAVDDHAAEQVASHVHRLGQPFGEQLGQPRGQIAEYGFLLN
jgi:hypothetical protein